MDFPIYGSFSDKKRFFTIITIDTMEDFTAMLDHHKTSKGIYRGVSSSEFKMLTSLQRKLINTGYQKIFSFELYLENIRSNTHITSYLSNSGISSSQFSSLSILQHYGVPSPLLDFTTDISIALNFGSLKHESGKIFGSLLQNYFSLYYISNDDRTLFEIEDVLNSAKETDAYLGKLERYDGKKKSKVFDRSLDFFGRTIALIEHSNTYSCLFNPNNTKRISAQKGLFIYNSSTLPLEEQVKENQPFISTVPTPLFFLHDKQYVNQELIDDNQRLTSNQLRMQNNFITCYEINKKLIPQLRKRLALEETDLNCNSIDNYLGDKGEEHLNKELLCDIFNTTLCTCINNSIQK